MKVTHTPFRSSKVGFLVFKVRTLMSYLATIGPLVNITGVSRHNYTQCFVIYADREVAIIDKLMKGEYCIIWLDFC